MRRPRGFIEKRNRGGGDDEEKEEGKEMTLWRQDASTQGGYVKAAARRIITNPKDATTLEQ
jgi:hypothetical protein